jgi:hypothetical protein
MLLQNIPVLFSQSALSGSILSTIPLQSIKQSILIGFVFPHGVTDLFHAQLQKKMPELLKINITTIVSCFCAYFLKQEYIIQTIFLLSSIAHFRNDMPLITIKKIDPKIIQIVLSTIVNISFSFVPIDFFIIYMTCIHTPNHYKISWSFLKESRFSLVSIIGLGFFLTRIPKQYIEISKSMIVEMTPMTVAVKSIIISHIIYQETNIFDKNNIYSYIKKILENIFFLSMIWNKSKTIHNGSKKMY